MTRQEITAWRLFYGLKQSDVAQMFGLTEAEVRAIENGAKPVPDDWHQKIKDGRNR